MSASKSAGTSSHCEDPRGSGEMYALTAIEPAYIMLDNMASLEQCLHNTREHG